MLIDLEKLKEMAGIAEDTYGLGLVAIAERLDRIAQLLEPQEINVAELMGDQPRFPPIDGE